MKVVVVRILADPLELAVASPGGAQAVGDFASDRTAAIPAACDTGVGVQPERVPVDLVDTIKIGGVPSPSTPSAAPV